MAKFRIVCETVITPSPQPLDDIELRSSTTGSFWLGEEMPADYEIEEAHSDFLTVQGRVLATAVAYLPMVLGNSGERKFKKTDRLYVEKYRLTPIGKTATGSSWDVIRAFALANESLRELDPLRIENR